MTEFNSGLKLPTFASDQQAAAMIGPFLKKGYEYFNSVTLEHKIYNGSSWLVVGSPEPEQQFSLVDISGGPVPTGFEFDDTAYRAVELFYTLEVVDGGKETGKITILNNVYGTPDISHVRLVSTYWGDPQIAFSADISGNKVRLIYTNSGGSPASLKLKSKNTTLTPDTGPIVKEITVEYSLDDMNWFPLNSGDTIQITDEPGGAVVSAYARITNSGTGTVILSNELATGDLAPPGDKIDVSFIDDGPVLLPGQARKIDFQLSAGSNFGAGLGVYNAQVTFEHDAINAVSPFTINFEGTVALPPS